jgi:adenine-specific DNA-methyltransferase
MQEYLDRGDVSLGKYHKDRDDWTIRYRVPRKNSSKLKTVWTDATYDAGTHGTNLINKLLGERGLFPFPKSLYLVRDSIAAVVRNRPNALILDFFAGSGTTLHATCLLNAADGGNRRCILVTNNEVAEGKAKSLSSKGIYPGDPEFESHGIFENVTRPRCEAAITGKSAEGEWLQGKYLIGGGSRGRLMRNGFDENIEFFKLEYLDPNGIGLGRAFKAILPAIWLASGGLGKREVVAKGTAFSIPDGSTFAILFEESHFRKFKEALKKRQDLTHLWIITDSEEAFAEMRSDLIRSGLLKKRRIVMLYRDYLRNFAINTHQNL